MQTPRVSVNIAVKDRRELLASCLDALSSQTFHDFEVVIVDNGSTDGTRALIDERVADASTPYPIVCIDSLGTLGAVRNDGVDASRGEFVAFVDSDCAPAPDWLERGIGAFAGEPRLAVVQGATLPDPSQERGRWNVTQEITAFTDRYEACNLFYRRSALVDAGGFDEAIGFFGEDSAAGWAVRRAGWDARFAADAVVHHTVTHPGLQWHLRRGLRYGNWNALVRRFPEMRRVLWHRLFLRPASARTLAALAGAGLAVAGVATRQQLLAAGGIAAATPFALTHRPYAWRRTAIVDAVGAAGFDVAVELALLWGTIRERTVVL